VAAGVSNEDAPKEAVRVLVGPTPIFEIDFSQPLPERSVTCTLTARAHAAGTLNAFAVCYTLHLRPPESESASPSPPPSPGCCYSTGPDNPRLVAWSQSLRYLPTPVRVGATEELELWAHHTGEAVCVGLLHIDEAALKGVGVSSDWGGFAWRGGKWSCYMRGMMRDLEDMYGGPWWLGLAPKIGCYRWKIRGRQSGVLVLGLPEGGPR
jgi:hypothetical protein